MTNPHDENDLIRRVRKIFKEATSKELLLGLGDDAALWQSRPAYETVFTCDWFLEDSHFIREKHPADSVGWKCLARALSDIAAMGAEPRCFLLSLALPTELTTKWLDGFLQGLRSASKRFRCELAGGDTTRQKKVLINISVIGEVRRGRALLRSGAHVDDEIFVSGTLGEAEAGFVKLKDRKGIVSPRDRVSRKHLYPEPRLALGKWLAEQRLASAAMDLSDGLSSDLHRLCVASNVGARIDLSALPVIGNGPRRHAQQFALHGGDDYELLFTVRKKTFARIPAHFRKLKLTKIGEITRAKQIVLNASGSVGELQPGGWDPFRNG